jgi:hypothetical protein
VKTLGLLILAAAPLYIIADFLWWQLRDALDAYRWRSFKRAAQHRQEGQP